MPVLMLPRVGVRVSSLPTRELLRRAGASGVGVRDVVRVLVTGLPARELLARSLHPC